MEDGVPDCYVELVKKCWNIDQIIPVKYLRSGNTGYKAISLVQRNRRHVRTPSFSRSIYIYRGFK